MPKPTLASLTKANAALKRENTGLRGDVRAAEQAYERKVDKVEELMDSRDIARKSANEWKSKFHTIELEAARLSGYVNRVEVIDHANWHALHGNIVTVGPKGDKDTTCIKPLCASSFTLPF